MTAAKAIFIFATPTAAIKISSTHILEGGCITLLNSSTTPGLRGHLNAFVDLLEWVIGTFQFIMSMHSLCFSTKSGWLANFFDSASIALRKGSQHAADVFDPKTMAIAKKYRLAAKNPKAPVKSGWILGNLKHALISAKAKRIGNSG